MTTTNQFANWIPPEQRRPDDEFICFDDLPVIATEQISDSITKLILTRGSGSPPTLDDTVYYKHETRYDNGQLVNLDERRLVAQKFPMSDYAYHDFLRQVFLTMGKGEVAFIKLGKEAHNGIYHSV